MNATVEEIQMVVRLLNEWVDAVHSSSLSEPTKATYIEHPARFARWLAGEYEFPSEQ